MRGGGEPLPQCPPSPPDPFLCVCINLHCYKYPCMLVGCVCVPKLYDNHRLISSLASLTAVCACIHVY